MVWERTGKCTQCGECCKVPYMAHPPMLNEDKTACKYLRIIDGIYICLMTSGLFNNTIALSIDVPEDAMIYWKTQCRPYPNPEDYGHTPPNHILPSGCTFTMRRVE